MYHGDANERVKKERLKRRNEKGREMFASVRLNCLESLELVCIYTLSC